MRFIQRSIVLFYLIILGLSCTASGFVLAETPQAPNVVVSITPFYSIVAALMKGVGAPKLLVPPGASPHNYALKPSEVQLLTTADIIIWGGPNLESFLVKPLNAVSLKPTVIIVQLDALPGLTLLPTRHSANFEEHEHTEHCCPDSPIDMHFWLDPTNGIKMAEFIKTKLIERDPLHQKLYQANAAQFKKEIMALDKQLTQQLQTIQHRPFLVFHDAYQYFETHYQLAGVGAITLNPEIPPSAKRLQTIQDKIQNTETRCVFSEPQFSPKLIESLTLHTNIKTGQLDPLGPLPKPGENGYAELLKQLGNSLSECLQPKK